MRFLKKLFRPRQKKTDVFHKYQKLKKVIGSKALPVAIGTSVVFVICLFGLIPGISFENIFKIDVVLSVGLVTVVTWFVSFAEKMLNRRIEEKLKLNGNYSENVNRYSKETVFERGNKKYPLVEICPRIDSIKVNLGEKSKFELDPIIVRYMSELMSAHKTSRFHNKPIYRIESYKYENNNLEGNPSPSDDYKTLLTNRVMDFELHDHITVREVFEPGPRLNSFENSKLCNGFGFNFIVRTSDGYYSMVKKTNKNPTNKYKTSHFSSTLNTHFNDEDDSYEGRLRQLSYNALITNYNYPRGYKNEELYKTVKLQHIHYLGLIRNLIEGGKPELCYLLDLEKTKDELVRQFNDATEEQKRDRGVDRIVTFLPEEYKILNDDRLDFGDGNEATVPLVGMYILEKIKDLQTNIDKIAE